MFSAMIPLPGNRYFFAGTAASDISCTKSSTLYGDEDFVTMIFDDNGNKLSERSYGGNGWDQLTSAIKLSNGGFLLIGETQSGVSGTKTSPLIGSSDIWALRIDDNGNVIWDKTFGGLDYEAAAKVVQTPDGGFLIGGISLSNTPGYNFGGSDYLIVKIDAAGNQLWEKKFGGSGRDELIDLIPTSDGNYFLSGTSDSPVNGNKTGTPIGADDIWVIKMDEDGNSLWDKCFGTASGDYRGRLLRLTDNNTLIVESSTNTGRIRKIDNDGNLIWLKSCSGNDQDFFELATQDVATGNIYVAGTSKTNNFGCKTSLYNGGGWFSDIWIAIFDANGNKIGDLDYGGNDADIPTDIDFINDEIWITGWSDSPMGGNKTTNNCGQTADGWVIRLSKTFYVNATTPNSLCLSQLNTKVHFTTAGNYNPGNIFTAQLSDLNGSFNTPTNIGTIASVKTDSIIVTLPANLLPGSNYKFRVIASSPLDTTGVYTVWIHGPPELNLGVDTILCTNTTITLNAGLQPSLTEYLWQNNSTNSTMLATQPGIYWCEVTSSCGTKRDSIIIQSKSKPFINVGPDVGFCSGNSIHLSSGSIGATDNYLWSTGSDANSITVTNGGQFWLQASNVCGTIRDSVTVTAYNLPVTTLGKDSILCKGLTRQLNAGAGFATYAWSTGEATENININDPGLYWVRVQDQHECFKSDTLIVKLAIPPSDFLNDKDSICSYEKLVLTPNRSFATYQWNSGLNTKTIEVKDPGQYWLKVTDNNKCSATDTITIYPRQCLGGFYIPNAFTPNNDGRNDVFKPVIGGELQYYTFSIYNRWGEVVFKTTDISKGWDGNFKGMQSDSNVFIWTCSYQLEGEARIFDRGTVMLIR